MNALKTASQASLGASVLCVVVCLLYLLGKIPTVGTNLAVTPGFVIPSYMKLWTLITAPLYENQWFMVPCSVAAIFASGSLLESLWGVKEFLIFQAVSGVGGFLVATILYLVLYMLTSSEDVLFATLQGAWPLVGGALVAMKQIKPDFTLIPTPQIRAKFWLPLVLLVVSVLPVTGLFSWSCPVLLLTGAISAWVYLRFYQPQADGRRGDFADHFAFASFFPEFMHRPVVQISGVVYSALVTVKVCPKWVRSYDISSSSAVTIKLPGVDLVDAERRKQKALKALNDRLSKVDNPSSPTAWPSMEDADPPEQPERQASAPPPPPSRPDKSETVSVPIDEEELSPPPPTGSSSDMLTV